MKNFILKRGCFCIKTALFAGLLTLSLNVQGQFSESSPIFPNQQSQNTSGVFSGQEAFAPSQAFSPFAPSQQTLNKQGELFDPALYGPGGNPIGGLPMKDGAQFLFFAVFGYCIYKILQKYKALKL